MPKQIYDVVVIGTGAGGGMAIKTLCEAGLKVCALNAGRALNPAKDFRNHRMPYDMKYRAFGDPKKHAQSYGYMDNEYTEGHLGARDQLYDGAGDGVDVAAVFCRRREDQLLGTECGEVWRYRFSGGESGRLWRELAGEVRRDRAVLHASRENDWSGGHGAEPA